VYSVLNNHIFILVVTGVTLV